MTHYEFRKAIALALLDPKNYWPNRMRQSSKLASSVASEAGGTHSSTTTISSNHFRTRNENRTTATESTDSNRKRSHVTTCAQQKDQREGQGTKK